MNSYIFVKIFGLKIDHCNSIFIYPELIGTIESLDRGLAVNVAEVSSNSRCVDNIVEGQLGHQGGLLQQQGQGLSNTTAGTADGDFGVVLKI